MLAVYNDEQLIYRYAAASSRVIIYLIASTDEPLWKGLNDLRSEIIVVIIAFSQIIKNGKLEAAEKTHIHCQANGGTHRRPAREHERRAGPFLMRE